jgi:DNA-binding transcriptional LysR family regulator
MKTNIDTGLLRTFVTVAELGNFTKAAQSLGVSQPTVSGHIRRLQSQLNGKLLKCGARGVTLTPQGEQLVKNARQLLCINDQIVDAADCRERTIRVGAPGDFVATTFSLNFGRFRDAWPSVCFEVRIGSYEPMLRDLQQGDLDLLIGLSVDEPTDARHHWPETMAWVRSKNTTINLDQPIPLMCYNKDVINRKVATTALSKAGLKWKDVLICPSFVGLAGAVAAGVGVMTLVRRRVSTFGLQTWDDGPLPKLCDIHFGIYIRQGGERGLLEQLADSLADALRPDSAATADFAPAHKLVEAVNSAA